MNAVTTITTRPAQPPAPSATGSALIPVSMDQAVRLAEMMARAKLVPQHLQGSPGDCLLIVEQAMRWNMSPFAVAQCASSIKGKLMFEGKLVAAAVESSGVLDGYLDYRFEGEGQGRKIIVSGLRRGEREPRSVEVALKDAQTDNGMWKKQPDQQLVYHGARVWARRWAPAVLLGVYSPEEFSRGETPDDGRTIDGTAETVNTTMTAAAIGDSIPALDDGTLPPDGHKWGSADRFLDALDAALRVAQDAAAVDAILARGDVQKALDALQNGRRDRLNGMVKAALERTGEPTNDGEFGQEQAA